ncbi:MAG TPA: asparagine synthase (glutamine-hydrolyzing) [Solirubrobacteraceae bacterium]|nr:asparagine synthase (glutamine-hydrolyzing) [Solirubrobacteraceae bacterium]
MCGIAGCVCPPGSEPDRSALARMADTLEHRGPDDVGVEVAGRVGLVHRRLSIVDPTPAGHQPMELDGGRWWLTYNGEVFNHLELRAALGARPWRGGTDTETLLHALDAWGEDAIARCNGLYAFAALDRDRGRLLLVRDRFGVKPLYVARHAGALWFASEIRALLAAGVPRAARPEVVAHAVAYGWSGGAPTPIDGVDRVAPGTLLDVDLETLAVRERRWDDPAGAVDPERAAALARRPRAALAAELEDELRASVRRRLMADVAVGTMCSGGLDSSLITAFARDEHPRIVAYNAAVVDQPGADEGPWAELVAGALGVELRTARLDADAWRAGLVPAVVHNELPLIHESSVPMAMIAAMAHGDGVKVLLSGEGADELFAGYDFLHPAEYAALLPAALRRRQRVEVFRSRLAALARRRGRGAGQAALRRLRDGGPLPGLRRRLGDGGIPGLGRPGRAGGGRSAGALLPAWAPGAAAHAEAVRARAATAYAHHPRPRGALEAALLGDLSTYLPHLLNRQDKNTMQASIETRVPFLDPAVVALALNLPIEARTRPLRKGVLRDLGAAHLPARVSRRAKVGFGFDVRRYLDGAARPEFLADGALRDVFGLTRDDWAAVVAGAGPPHALRLWSGEAWWRLFIDGAEPDTVTRDLWR